MHNCYVLCFIPNHKINPKESIRRQQLIEDRYSMFFVDNNDGIEYISEMNTKALHDIITSSKNTLKIFWINSIKDYSKSPTLVSELIITCLKYNIIFHSEQDNLYFDNIHQINDVYYKIFELFKRKLK